MVSLQGLTKFSNLGWWAGVVVKREVENGIYEPQFVSKKWLEENYK